MGRPLLDWRVLGPLEVIRDDGGLAVVPRRERALVSVLLVSAGPAVGRDTLARALWGEKPPADTPGQLRVVLSRARAALGKTAGGCLTTTKEGSYLASPAAGEFDLARFRDLRGEARHRLEDGTLPQAGSALQDALACWRDPPLADLPDTPVSAAQRDLLLAERQAAELDLTDVLLALGEHQKVVAGLNARVVADPHCQRSWAQFMLALYRCGRKSDALAAYTKATAALRPPYGDGPGPDLQAMLHGILTDWRGGAGVPAPRIAPAPAGTLAALAASERALPATL